MFRVFLMLIPLLGVVVLAANPAKSSFPGFETIEMQNSNEKSFVSFNKVFEIESLDFVRQGRGKLLIDAFEEKAKNIIHILLSCYRSFHDD